MERCEQEEEGEGGLCVTGKGKCGKGREGIRDKR